MDSLDTLAVTGNITEFSRAVGVVSSQLSFDIDHRVSVFEVTIRAMGGLLSAHMLASGGTENTVHNTGKAGSRALVSWFSIRDPSCD